MKRPRQASRDRGEASTTKLLQPKIDIPGISRRQQLTLLGNGVVPPQAAAALEDMLTCVPEEEGELHSR